MPRGLFGLVVKRSDSQAKSRSLHSELFLEVHGSY